MPTGAWQNAQIGPWKLVEFLGAGGMGEVYRGMNLTSGDAVAIKLLTTAQESAALRARFANEARIHSELRHPAIARMVAFTSHHGIPAIVMEFVGGDTLDNWLATHGPMPIGQALDCMNELIGAIEYLHQRETVHRDIKSSNVKLTPSGRVKLLDFGIAKGPDSPTLTADGCVIGTLQALAPEQLAGAPADAQTEIWALGILLYELLTARHPFAAPGVEGITARIRSARYPAPTSSRPDLPRGVDEVVARCLRVDPRERYDSCATLREAIVRLRRAATTPVIEWPSTLASLPDLSELPHQVRKNFPVVLAATAALVAAVFVVFGLWSRIQGRSASPGVTPIPASIPATSDRLKSQNTMRVVTINTVNGAAEVWQSGAVVGSTPYALHLALGTDVQLILRRAGYHDEQVRFTVTEGRTEYSFVLRPAPVRPESQRPTPTPLLFSAAWFVLPWKRKQKRVSPPLDTIDRPILATEGLGVESRVIIGTASDPGCHRSNNEDAVRVVRSADENGPLLAMVCDGMGGHAAGEEASRIAAETVTQEFRAEGDLGQALAHAVRRANHAVYRAASDDATLRGMGTTCTALVLHGGLAWCAHVGDSRCYLIRDKEILVMTEDHSAVMTLVREGAISREEAREHPEKNVISRALGSHPELEVATWPRPFVVRPGDRFLLSSDGLHDVLPESQILEVVDALPPHLACQELVRRTRDAGAPDNVSVVILGMPHTELSPLPVTGTSRVLS